MCAYIKMVKFPMGMASTHWMPRVKPSSHLNLLRTTKHAKSKSRGGRQELWGDTLLSVFYPLIFCFEEIWGFFVQWAKTSDLLIIRQFKFNYNLTCSFKILSFTWNLFKVEEGRGEIFNWFKS